MIPHPDPASLREELREKIARAICRSWNAELCDRLNCDLIGHCVAITGLEDERRIADTCIAALSTHLASAGWRVVPVEPTNDINFCIHAAIERAVGSMIHDPIAPAAWKAGVAASPDPLAPADRPTGETDG